MNIHICIFYTWKKLGTDKKNFSIKMAKKFKKVQAEFKTCLLWKKSVLYNSVAPFDKILLEL